MLAEITPTAILAVVALVATVRARRLVRLVAASRALCALLVLDIYHHACRPPLDARRAGAALSSAEVWVLRLDAWIVAGGWCAVVSWLLLCAHAQRVSCARPYPSVCGQSRVSVSQRMEENFAELPLGELPGGAPRVARRSGTLHRIIGVALVGYGVAAVSVARTWPEAWTPLLVVPRFAVGALAWWSSGASGENRTPSPREGRAERRGPSSFYTGRNTNGPRRIVDLGRAVRRGLGCRSLGSLAPSRAFRRSTAGSSGYPQNDERSLAPSLLIGQIIAACQVGAASFLWSRWGDVRILSSVCWTACAWVAWRA